MASNLHHPGGTVPDPNPAAASGAMVPTPPFVFGVKSQKRLMIACNLVCYYNTAGCNYTPANMQWTHMMKNFEIQWKALKDWNDGKTPEVPKIMKQLLIIKWTESFKDFLSQVIGVCMIPLAYIIQYDVQVPVAAPAMENNQPHSLEHGSIELELITHASHMHASY